MEMSRWEVESDETAKYQAFAALMTCGTHSFLTSEVGRSPSSWRTDSLLPYAISAKYKNKPTPAIEHFKPVNNWGD